MENEVFSDIRIYSAGERRLKGQKNLSGYRKLYRIIYEFGKQMTIKNISSFAASTAFFLFISLIPILYLVCSILPYVNITQETLRQSVDAVLPGVIEIGRAHV